LEDLGDEAKEIHMKIGYYISALPIDVVLTVGNDARYVGDGIRQINHNKKVVQHCKVSQEIPALVPKYIKPNTTLLMIGGRSLKLSTQLKKLMTVLKKT